MGFGKGWWWHRFLPPFPNFPYVTKTVTLKPRKGNPYTILPFGRSVFNKLGLPNPGFHEFLKIAHISPNATISIAGTDDQIEYMTSVLDVFDIGGIELNFTCPNVCDHKNIRIPESRHPLFLKLNYLSDPYVYELDKIARIRLNSVPCKFGGGSGQFAKEKNFAFIQKFIKEGLSITGASFTTYNDILELIDIGCTEIGIGAAILVNPRLILSLKYKI